MTQLWKSSNLDFTPHNILKVCSSEGSSIATCSNLLSRAASSWKILLYSELVVAPIQERPLASSGFNRFAASTDPEADPAPIILCISSMNKIVLLLACNSSITLVSLFSNSPLYLVPAINVPRFKE